MTLIALGAALPITAIIWYPEWVWLAYVVGIPTAIAGLLRAMHEPVRQGWVRSGGRARWLPGFGLGLGLLHWPPRLYAWLGLWRRR